MRPAEERELRARKARDAALILPLIGLLLLTPPFAQVFANDSRILGVPTVVVYVFSIWAALILIAQRLSVLLSSDEPTQPPED